VQFNADLEQYQGSFEAVSRSKFKAVSVQFQCNFSAISEQFQCNFRAISGQFQNDLPPFNPRAISDQYQCSSRAVSEEFQPLNLTVHFRALSVQ